MKLLIFLLFSSLFLFAEEAPTFYVSNPTMGKAYFDILNGIVALMNNETYIDLLRFIFVLGGFAIFIMGILKVIQGGDSKTPATEFTKYMISGMMILTLLYSGSTKEMLVVSDELSTDVCDNSAEYSGYSVSMPEILTFAFSGMNNIGRQLTEMSASIYTGMSGNPGIDDSLIQSSKNGVGSQVEGLQALLSVRLDDLSGLDGGSITLGQSQTFGNSQLPINGSVGYLFKTLFNQCVNMIAASDPESHSTLQTILRSTSDLKDSLNQLYSTSAAGPIGINYPKSGLASWGGTQYTAMLNNPGAFTMMFNGYSGTCNQFYTDYIAPILYADSNTLLCGAKLTDRITPASLYLLTGNDTVAASATMQDLILNSAITNTLQESNSENRLATDVAFAGGKSTAEFVLTNTGTGAYMAKMIPYLQMAIRAILYAFFPFVFVVILFPGGFGVFKSYVESMLWVELWAPVAAVLNMFMAYFQLDKINAHYASGMNYSTSINVASDANMLAAVAGYLYMSVPALTWLVLKGSAQMLGSISGGMASNFNKNFSTQSMMQDRETIKRKDLYEKNSGKESSIAMLAELEADSKAGQSAGYYATLESSKSGAVGASYKQGASQAIGVLAAGQEYDVNSKLSNGNIDEMASRKSMKAITDLFATETFRQKYAQMHGLSDKDAESQLAIIAKEVGSIQGMDQILKEGGSEAEQRLLGLLSGAINSKEDMKNFMQVMTGKEVNINDVKEKDGLFTYSDGTRDVSAKKGQFIREGSTGEGAFLRPDLTPGSNASKRFRDYVQGKAFNEVTAGFQGNELKKAVGGDANYAALVKAGMDTASITKFAESFKSGGSVEQSLRSVLEDERLSGKDGLNDKQVGLAQKALTAIGDGRIMDAVKATNKLMGQLDGTTSLSKSLQEKLTKENELKLGLGATQKADVAAFKTLKEQSGKEGELEGAKELASTMMSIGSKSERDNWDRIHKNLSSEDEETRVMAYGEVAKNFASKSTVNQNFEAEKTNQIIKGFEAQGININDLSQKEVLEQVRGISEQNTMVKAMDKDAYTKNLIDKNISGDNDYKTDMLGKVNDHLSNLGQEKLSSYDDIQGNDAARGFEESIRRSAAMEVLGTVTGENTVWSSSSGNQLIKNLVDSGYGTQDVANNQSFNIQETRSMQKTLHSMAKQLMPNATESDVAKMYGTGKGLASIGAIVKLGKNLAKGAKGAYNLGLAKSVAIGAGLATLGAGIKFNEKEILDALGGNKTDDTQNKLNQLTKDQQERMVDLLQVNLQKSKNFKNSFNAAVEVGYIGTEESFGRDAIRSALFFEDKTNNQ